jgi:hypothetical protein
VNDSKVIYFLRAILSLAIFLTCLGEGAVFPSEPLSEGNAGIAFRYPGDFGIEGDPAVIFSEDFESGKLERFENVYGQFRFIDPEHDFFPSRRALEWAIPQKDGAIGGSAWHQLKPGFDRVYARVYWWLAPDFKVDNMHGWSLIAVRPGVDFPGPGAGIRADGTDKFNMCLDYPWRDLSPYVYHPEQKTRWGDHFSTRFKMELGRWYCIEIMQKANTPGKRDGEMAVWADGRLIKRWTGLRLRDVPDLKINLVTIGLYIHNNRYGLNRTRYDNSVVATSYIGPVLRSGGKR